MRSLNAAFAALHNAQANEPRWIVSLSFADDGSDTWYLTSHTGTPTPNAANTLYGVLSWKGLRLASQALDVYRGTASIGALSVDIVDLDGDVSALLASKASAGKTAIRKDVQVWKGYAELAAFADYELYQTMILEEFQLDRGVYKLQANDPQRFLRQQLFTRAPTELAANIDTANAVWMGSGTRRIKVKDITAFRLIRYWRTATLITDLLTGGATYADAGFAAIGSDEEIQYFRFTAIDTVTSELVNCAPVFGTQFRTTEAFDDAGASNEVEIRQVAYIEAPAGELLYSVLTNRQYGLAGEITHLPDTWGCGLDLKYLSTAEFVNCGSKFWTVGEAGDTDANRIGRENAALILQFFDPPESDAEEFVAEQICRPMGYALVVRESGEFGLMRVQRVGNNAPAELTLTEDHLISHSELRVQASRVVNKIQVLWGYDPATEKFRRGKFLIDSQSLELYKSRDEREFKFYGLDRTRYGLETIFDLLLEYRYRLGAPPLSITCVCRRNTDVLQLGEIVRLAISNLNDPTTGDSLDRAFQIVSKQLDAATGNVTLVLEGSLQDDRLLALDGPGSAIADAWYAMAGTAINPTNFPGAVSIVGGVTRITGPITLTGNAALTQAPNNQLNPACVFYVDGDLYQDARITINQNVVLKVRGFWERTANGHIDGAGRGTPNADGARYLNQSIEIGQVWQGMYPSAGNYKGYAPTAKLITANATYPKFSVPLFCVPATPMPAIVFSNGDDYPSWTSFGSAVFVREIDMTADGGPYGMSAWSYAQKRSEIPALTLKRDGAYNASTYMTGFPADLRGANGVPGGGVAWESTDGWKIRVKGGSGGRGGAGLVVIHRGTYRNPSATIDLSGAAPLTDWGTGTPPGFGDGLPSGDGTITVLGGSGTSGQPGAYYEIIDGGASEYETPSPSALLFDLKAQPLPASNRLPLDSYYLPSTVESGNWCAGKTYSETLAETNPYNIPSIADTPRPGYDPTTNYYRQFVKQILLTPVGAVSSIPAGEAAVVMSIDTSVIYNMPPGQNKATVEVTINEPSDPRYDFAVVEWRWANESGWREAWPAEPETAFVVPTDVGGSLQIRARSVSLDGTVSADGLVKTISITQQAGVGTPSGIAITQQANSIQLRFTPAALGLKTEIYVLTASGQAPGASNRLDTIEGQSTTLAGLAANTTYYLRLRHLDAYGNAGAYTLEQAFTTLANAAGGNTTYYQASAPATPAAGDIWYDSDDSNRQYRYSGTDFVSVRDTGIAAAQATADSKSDTYTGTDSPSPSLGKLNDLYVQTFTVMINGSPQEMKSVWQKRLVNSVLTWAVIASSGCHFDQVYGATRPEDGATVGADWGDNLVNIPNSLLYADTDDVYESLNFWTSDMLTSSVSGAGVVSIVSKTLLVQLPNGTDTSAGAHTAYGSYVANVMGLSPYSWGNVRMLNVAAKFNVRRYTQAELVMGANSGYGVGFRQKRTGNVLQSWIFARAGAETAVEISNFTNSESHRFLVITDSGVATFYIDGVEVGEITSNVPASGIANYFLTASVTEDSAESGILSADSSVQVGCMRFLQKN